MRPVAFAIIAVASLLSASLTQPLVAKTNSSAAVITARQKIFGLENVDPEAAPYAKIG
jgi:hypothetical protein